MIRLAIIAAILCACGSVDPKPDPPNPYDVDTASCENAAKHLEALGCEDELYVEDADETTNKSNVEDWIDYCEDSKTLSGMDEPTDCLAVINTCDEIDACYDNR